MLTKFKTNLNWLRQSSKEVIKYLNKFANSAKKIPFPKIKKRRLPKFVNWRNFGIAAIVFLVAFYLLILRDLPSPTKLGKYDVPLASSIYDRNGKLLYEIYAEQNRTLVKLDQIPKYLKDATISMEDKDFYKHRGIDPVGGILRAIKNIITKQRLEGGSTITQQLIKSALLTPDRTIQRKVKELILAPWAETIYSKDQILEMYFNQVPYGGTAWGVESAAKKYFNKDVWKLNLAESALLAGLPAAPTTFSPFGAYPELAITRQHEVLKRMVDEGYITKDQMEKAKKEPLYFASSHEDIKAPHFVMYVKDQLVQKYGEKAVEQGGLKVTTTLDLEIQEYAQKVVEEEIKKIQQYHVGNGASLVTRPPTGEILAMVGSYDYFATGSGNVNVTLAHRQPGSSIKPINYAIGLETKKVTPASVFLDYPTCFQVAFQPLYCPKNYDGNFHGPVQLRFALGNSYNIPAVDMLYLNSLKTMVASASAFGLDTIKDPDKYGLSLTLGGGEVTMLDMSKAFGIFANTGKRKDLVSILKVEDKNGKVLEEFTDDNYVSDIHKPLTYPTNLLINGPKVISPETAYLISHILLDDNARSGAFSPHSLLELPAHKAVSVKTGTTDDLRDNWTIGFTPNFLVAVWVGNNDDTPMNHYLVSGVTGAAPIWHKIITKVLEKQNDLWPKIPDGIVGKSVCSLSGLLPVSEGSCPARFEYFIKGTEPKMSENIKQQILIDKNTNNIASPDQKDNVEMQDHTVLKDVLGHIICLDCPGQIAPGSDNKDNKVNFSFIVKEKFPLTN